MRKGRLEAFSDGVLAIIITIMVLELRIPHGEHPGNLLPLLPILISYILSFVHIGIYWNNHHHMFQAVRKVRGGVLWANLFLLFWLSLLPFATGWMGENNFSKWPVAFYGFILLMAAIAYFILASSLLRLHGKNSTLSAAFGNDIKGKISIIIYIIAILLTFLNPWIGFSIYVIVAIIWIIPDRRIERVINE